MTRVARGRLLWFVLFALLAAQALGLAHRIAHGAPGSPAPVTFAQPHEGAGWADGLLAGHADDVTCHVFDQVSQGGGLWALPELPAPPFFAHRFLTWFQGEALARWSALFDARGPPTLR